MPKITTMIVVVTAATGFAFLTGWELMTLVSAALILIEADSEERRHNVLIYLVMMHAGAPAVATCSFLFLPYSHRLDFGAIRARENSEFIFRLHVRIAEVAASAEMIQEAAGSLPEGIVFSPAASKRDIQGLSAVESPRGEFCYWSSPWELAGAVAAFCRLPRHRRRRGRSHSSGWIHPRLPTSPGDVSVRNPGSIAAARSEVTRPNPLPAGRAAQTQ